MRVLLFDGTPEEFARVEALFTGGGTRVPAPEGLAVAPVFQPRGWPELDDGRRYELARLTLARAPARVRDAVTALAEVEEFHGVQTLAGWAGYAEARPEELAGHLAALGRGAARAFAELFGARSGLESARGGAYLVLARESHGGEAHYGLRPATRRALAELGLYAFQLGADGPEDGRESPHGTP